MHTASLKWITPNAEQEIIDIARVSSTKPPGEPGNNLIRYLVEHKHWSPFEMANACFEIRTTRDISRQLLRHRSFSFQEFSQRYSAVDSGSLVYREARLQHPTNRQLSVEIHNSTLNDFWEYEQESIWNLATEIYNDMLDRGIAREVARVVLPEGLTPTRLYMNGTIRSWIHFYEARSYEGAQKEIRILADAISKILRDNLPVVWGACYGEK